MGHSIPHSKQYPADLPDEPWAICAPRIPPPSSATGAGALVRCTCGKAAIRGSRSTGVAAHGIGCPRMGCLNAPSMTPWPSGATTGHGQNWSGYGVSSPVCKRGARPRRAPSASRAKRSSPPRWVALRVGMTGARSATGASGPSWSIRWGGRAVLLTRAGRDEGVAAPLLLGDVTPHAVPRLVTSVADQQEPNDALDAGRAEHRAGWPSEIPARPEGTKGLTPLAKRWGMERTTAWQGRYRRNRKDDERRPASSTAMLHSRNIHLRLNRRCPGDRPVLPYRKKAA